jgi:capsid protein
MGIFGKKIVDEIKIQEFESKIDNLQAQATENYLQIEGYHGLLSDLAFTGEKNPGELPDIPPYFVDYQTLAKNAYNVYLKTDNVQNIINRTCNDAIGTGLYMDYKPDNEALESLGLPIVSEEQEIKIQSLWRIWANSSRNDIKKEKCFNEAQKVVLHSVLIGGDIILIPRVDGKNVTFQLVDGSLCNDQAENKPESNEVIEGVEFNKSAIPVAYHVFDVSINKPRRIIRFSNDFNLERIFMIKSPLMYRPNDVRGVSAIGAILEKARKTDRFIEAAAANWEEAAKMPYWIEVDKDAQDEEYPSEASKVVANLRRGTNPLPKQSLSTDAEVATFQKTMMASYEKTIHKLPPGFSFKNFEYSQLENSEKFIEFLEDGMGLCLMMPPEVRKQSYNSNYTASRAAILGWFYTLDEVYRHTISEQLNKKMFQFWLAVMAANRVIRLDGYVEAIINNDSMAIEAYTKSLWIGRKAPQVDPLKEAKAIREMLGPEFLTV